MMSQSEQPKDLFEAVQPFKQAVAQLTAPVLEVLANLSELETYVDSLTVELPLEDCSPWEMLPGSDSVDLSESVPRTDQVSNSLLTRGEGESKSSSFSPPMDSLKNYSRNSHPLNPPISPLEHREGNLPLTPSGSRPSRRQPPVFSWLQRPNGHTDGHQFGSSQEQEQSLPGLTIESLTGPRGVVENQKVAQAGQPKDVPEIVQPFNQAVAQLTEPVLAVLANLSELETCGDSLTPELPLEDCSPWEMLPGSAPVELSESVARGDQFSNSPLTIGYSEGNSSSSLEPRDPNPPLTPSESCPPGSQPPVFSWRQRQNGHANGMDSNQKGLSSYAIRTISSLAEQLLAPQATPADGRLRLNPDATPLVESEITTNKVARVKSQPLPDETFNSSESEPSSQNSIATQSLLKGLHLAQPETAAIVEPKSEFNGSVQTELPLPIDPSLLAMLINEVLVQQARRHGVDLS